MKRGLFVTGTDTGVGKTVTSALLCSAIQNSGGAAGYLKPVQTGDEDDTATVRRLAALEPEGCAGPVYRFALPAAPSRAAEAEGGLVKLETLTAAWQALPERRWVVEGAGGLLVPLSRKVTMLDLVKLLELPLLIVASTRLGTINHTLLTLAAAHAAGVPVAGIVLCGAPDPGLRDVIGELDDSRIIAEIPVLEPLTPVRVAQCALDHFTPPVLSALFGPPTRELGAE
jgi:dethiobiotin synthetase